MESASRRISLRAVLTSSTGIWGLIDGRFGCLLIEIGATPISSSWDIPAAAAAAAAEAEAEAADTVADEAVADTCGESLGGLRMRISSIGIFSGIPL